MEGCCLLLGVLVLLLVLRELQEQGIVERLLVLRGILHLHNRDVLARQVPSIGLRELRLEAFLLHLQGHIDLTLGLNYLGRMADGVGREVRASHLGFKVLLLQLKECIELLLQRDIL